MMGDAMIAVTREMIASQKPLLSSPMMSYRDPARGSDKLYRGHMSFLPEHGLWIAWVEHGRRGARQNVSAVTKTATSAFAALSQLNAKLYHKQYKNRDRYAPLAGHDGEIPSKDLSDTISLMSSAHTLYEQSRHA